MKKTLLLISLVAAGAAALNAQDLGYTPLEGDYTANTPKISGTYLNDGFTITMYGDAVDDEGFISAAGDVVTLNFYTQTPGSEGFSVAGTYTYYDTEAWMNQVSLIKFGPGDLMGGFMFVLMPGYTIPMGSLISIYDDELNEVVGLAGPGSELVVTYKGDGIYNLTANFVTFQDAKVTAQWEGPLADFVENFPETTALTSVHSDDAPAVYYNMQGVRVADPQPGQVYISVSGNKASKVIVK